MKTKIILILAMFTVCFSCKKDVETDSNEILEIFKPGIFGYDASGIKTIGNGKNGSFKMMAGGVISKGQNLLFSMDFLSFSDNMEERDIFGVFNIPLKKGSSRINGVSSKDNTFAFYARRMSDGDITGAYYDRDESKFSNIEITELDTVANYARGKLNVYFVMQGKSVIPNLPQKVSFTSVDFNVLLTWK